MPIEISGKTASNIHHLNSSTASSGAKITSTNTARPAADTVSLTHTAAYIRSLENKLAALPVVDTNRTESIKKSLAEGRFVIDPARVADKLLRFESMFYYRAA